MNVELTKYTQQTESYQKTLKQGGMEQTDKVQARAAKAQEAPVAPQGDRVSLSEDARLRTQAFSTAMATSDVRQDRVNALKERVDNGTYAIDPQRIAQKMLQEEAELFG